MEDSGFLDLYFGNESYFGLTPHVYYTAQMKENPILLPEAKGKFLNVIGLMTRKNKLYFELRELTFNTDKIICFTDNFVA